MKNGWQTKRLGEVCEIIKGRKPVLKATSSNGDLPYLVAKVMRGSAEAEYASVKDRNSILVEESETIIICDGSNSGEVFTGFRGILSSTMGKISKKAEVDDNYLRAFLASTFDVFNGAKTGSAIPHLDKEAMYQLEFPFPPLAEQQRIVGLLDEAFAGIATAKANAEKNLQNAHALFESHLQSVFTQRGKGWVEKRLEEVCTFSSGGTPSKHNSSYWKGKIPWISGRDMKSTRLSDSVLHISRAAVEESSTRMAQAGTLLILVRGMGLAHGAQIAELLVPCAFNQDIRGIHTKPDLIPRYLLFALREGINSSNNVLSNAAHGTLKIDSDQLKSVMIPIPPREHQEKIVTTINALTEETQRLASIYERKLAAMAALNRSLLHQAFTGNL